MAHTPKKEGDLTVKLSKLTLISITLVATLLLGAFIALQVTAPKPVAINMKFDPNTLDLGAPGWAVKLVNVSLWFDTGKYKPEDIDPRTVLIEGVLGPKGGPKRTWIVHDWELRKWVLRFQVSGGDLIDLLWSKISHMGIPGPSATIPLTVTGYLYDGTPFAGTGYMNVLIPTEPPPNPA